MIIQLINQHGFAELGDFAYLWRCIGKADFITSSSITRPSLKGGLFIRAGQKIK